MLGTPSFNQSICLYKHQSANNLFSSLIDQFIHWSICKVIWQLFNKSKFIYNLFRTGETERGRSFDRKANEHGATNQQVDRGTQLIPRESKPSLRKNQRPFWSRAHFTVRLFGNTPIFKCWDHRETSIDTLCLLLPPK